MIIDHNYVMTADLQALTLLAGAVEMTTEQLERALRKNKAAQHIGTKFTNGVHSEAYAAGTLDHTTLGYAPLNDYVDALASAAPAFSDSDYDNAHWFNDALNASVAAGAAQAAERAAQAATGKRAMTKSAKAWLRELFDANDANGAPMQYTLLELITLTGKSEVNIRTMLSDLRSSTYAGKFGVYLTHSVRVANVTHYQRTVTL